MYEEGFSSDMLLAMALAKAEDREIELLSTSRDHLVTYGGGDLLGKQLWQGNDRNKNQQDTAKQTPHAAKREILLFFHNYLLLSIRRMCGFFWRKAAEADMFSGMGKGSAIYYYSKSCHFKFDVDDLFYYSNHKIMKRGSHLFVWVREARYKGVPSFFLLK